MIKRSLRFEQIMEALMEHLEEVNEEHTAKYQYSKFKAF